MNVLAATHGNQTTLERDRLTKLYGRHRESTLYVCRLEAASLVLHAELPVGMVCKARLGVVMIRKNVGV